MSAGPWVVTTDAGDGWRETARVYFLKSDADEELAAQKKRGRKNPRMYACVEVGTRTPLEIAAERVVVHGIDADSFRALEEAVRAMIARRG